MRAIFFVALSAALLGSADAAEEAKTNQAPGAAVAVKPAKPPPLTPEERDQYLRLVQAELGLNTRIKLLNELADEHLRRADEARASSTDKGRWETDLAQEFRNKSTGLLGELNDVTKQRLAIQAAHAPLLPPRPGGLEDNKALNADEFAYLTTLDQRLVKVRQELVAVDEAARGFYAELSTNNTPETIDRISYLLDENKRQAWLWEREESELQLKKLEFRALRK